MSNPASAGTGRDGSRLIADERQRQMAVEGWTPDHDDSHLDGEMIEGARGYLSAAFVAERGRRWNGPPPPLWPWNQSWWKPSDDPIRNLAKAGALIAAEIDRLQRASGRAVPDPLASDTGQGQISDREAAYENLIDMLQAVEWVRQSAGNKYACPFCHGITERDGGPGHADDCRWVKAVSTPDPLASSSETQGENLTAMVGDGWTMTLARSKGYGETNAIVVADAFSAVGRILNGEASSVPVRASGEPQNLKPCPFCGGEGRPAFDDNNHFTQVVCDSCGARGNEHPESERAIAAWNRRPSASPSDEGARQPQEALTRILHIANRALSEPPSPRMADTGALAEIVTLADAALKAQR